MHLVITYDKFVKKLKKIGYVEHRVTGNHLILGHPDFNSLIVIPINMNKKEIPLGALMSYKRIMIEQGVISNDEFNTFIN